RSRTRGGTRGPSFPAVVHPGTTAAPASPGRNRPGADRPVPPMRRTRRREIDTARREGRNAEGRVFVVTQADGAAAAEAAAAPCLTRAGSRPQPTHHRPRARDYGRGRGRHTTNSGVTPSVSAALVTRDPSSVVTSMSNSLKG